MKKISKKKRIRNRLRLSAKELPFCRRLKRMAIISMTISKIWSKNRKQKEHFLNCIAPPLVELLKNSALSNVSRSSQFTT
jgi:hypothetical protein